MAYILAWDVHTAIAGIEPIFGWFAQCKWAILLTRLPHLQKKQKRGNASLWSCYCACNKDKLVYFYLGIPTEAFYLAFSGNILDNLEVPAVLLLIDSQKIDLQRHTRVKSSQHEVAEEML